MLTAPQCILFIYPNQGTFVAHQGMIVTRHGARVLSETMAFCTPARNIHLWPLDPGPLPLGIYAQISETFTSLCFLDTEILVHGNIIITVLRPITSLSECWA